ncbi:hypothetical protein NC651_010407 [Populus alba x Populus x berolinensis]|nr:hypothetical protein NC651_010407 [Populus alba x Populus x berolinensis]
MLLFQYLVNALEGDFVPRNRVYGETMNWTCLRESWHLLRRMVAGPETGASSNCWEVTEPTSCSS